MPLLTRALCHARRSSSWRSAAPRCRSLATTEAAATRRKAIQKFGAPASIKAIPDESILLDHKRPSDTALPNALIRNLGCARRVFLLHPSLSATELEGLSYRLRAMTRNEGLSAILIASDSPKYGDDGDADYAHSQGLPLPDFVLDREDREQCGCGCEQESHDPRAVQRCG